jgi:hypothetical protein
LLEASHREHIDVLSSAIGVANQCAFNGKSKPLVQLNGCFVIGIDLQLKPQKVSTTYPLNQRLPVEVPRRRPHVGTHHGPTYLSDPHAGGAGDSDKYEYLGKLCTGDPR